MCCSVSDGLSLNLAIHGGAGDVEQLGEFGGGGCPGKVNFHRVTLLGCRQLGLIAAQAAFRFRHLHPFACSGADEVGFELCHHRQDVEQQTPDRVGRVMNGAAHAELDACDSEFVNDVFRIPQEAGQSVEFGNYEYVPVPAGREGFA
jgi:hypothetical protein